MNHDQFYVDNIMKSYTDEGEDDDLSYNIDMALIYGHLNIESGLGLLGVNKEFIYERMEETK